MNSINITLTDLGEVSVYGGPVIEMGEVLPDGTTKTAKYGLYSFPRPEPEYNIIDEGLDYAPSTCLSMTDFADKLKIMGATDGHI